LRQDHLDGKTRDGGDVQPPRCPAIQRFAKLLKHDTPLLFTLAVRFTSWICLAKPEALLKAGQVCFVVAGHGTSAPDGKFAGGCA
jgi:hypothetical protein